MDRYIIINMHSIVLEWLLPHTIYQQSLMQQLHIKNVLCSYYPRPYVQDMTWTEYLDVMLLCYNPEMIICRYVFSVLPPNAARYPKSYSKARSSWTVYAILFSLLLIKVREFRRVRLLPKRMPCQIKGSEGICVT